MVGLSVRKGQSRPIREGREWIMMEDLARVWYVNVRTGVNETHVRNSRRLGDPPRRVPSVELSSLT